MGRKRNFNQNDIIDKMVQVFIMHGYEGTSLDDLVQATGLLRGSLYSAFGSKQGMFIASLENSLQQHANDDIVWQLLLVAMLELTSRSEAVRKIVKDWYDTNSHEDIASELGHQLLAHSGIFEGEDNHGK